MAVEINKNALYEHFLKCIDREENLIHYRLTWGMQWNAAAFAAMFALYSVTKSDALSALIIGTLIASVAGIASVLSFIGVHAAHRQTEYLISEIKSQLGIENNVGRTSKQDWRTIGFLRPFGDEKYVHGPARMVSFVFPLISASGWVGIVLYFLFRAEGAILRGIHPFPSG